MAATHTAIDGVELSDITALYA